MKTMVRISALVTLAGTATAFTPSHLFGQRVAVGWSGAGRGSFLLAKVWKETWNTTRCVYKLSTGYLSFKRRGFIPPCG